MANTVMQSPEFEIFQDFAFPFGIILYYLFSFVIMTGTLDLSGNCYHFDPYFLTFYFSFQSS